MAADLTQSFWGKHIEKVVLGVGIVVLAASAAFFVVMRRPPKVRTDTITSIVEDIDGSVEDVDLNDILSPAEREALGLGEPLLTVGQFQQQLAALPEDWPENRDFVDGLPKKVVTGVIVEAYASLPEAIVPVTHLQTVQGRGVTTGPVPGALARTAGMSDIAWISTAGRVDLTKQRDLNAAGESQTAGTILVTSVDLQRRMLDPEGNWTEWKAVASTAAGAAAAEVPPPPSDPRDIRAAYEWWTALKKHQAGLRRPGMLPLEAVDPNGKLVYEVVASSPSAVQPGEKRRELRTEPARAAAGAGPVAPPAPTEVSPPPGVPAWAAEVRAPRTPAGEEPPFRPEPREEHVYANVWAHDTTVRPGRTYQYRMRVTVFNPVYGQEDPPVRPSEDRWKLTLAGPWSEPTEAVTVPPLVEFYFVGTFGDRVNLELHRWILGQWVIVPSAPTAIGTPVIYERPGVSIRVPGSGKEIRETINLSPGVLLVDMVDNFPYRPQGDNRPIRTNLLLYSAEDGSLRHRNEWEDKRQAALMRAERQNAVPTPPPPPPDTERGRTRRPRTGSERIGRPGAPPDEGEWREER